MLLGFFPGNSENENSQIFIDYFKKSFVLSHFIEFSLLIHSFLNIEYTNPFVDVAKHCKYRLV